MKKYISYSPFLPYLGVFAIALLMLFTGAHHDGVFFADNPDRPIWYGVALRVYEGQKPHLHFISTMGPGVPWLYGTFLKVLGDRPESLHYGSALLILLFACATLWLNARRWSLAVQLAYVAGLLIHMGYPTLNYNYLGYFFILLAALEGFSWDKARLMDINKKDSGSPWRNSSVLFGLFASFMFFAKYIFLIHGLGMLALAFLWSRPSRYWLIGFASGFALFSLAMFGWLDGNLAEMAHQLSISREIRGGLVLQEFLRPGFHLRFFHKYVWGFLLTIVPFVFIWKKRLGLKLHWLFFVIPLYLFVLQNAVILSGSNWPHPYGKEWLAAIALLLLPFRHFEKYLVLCFYFWAGQSLYANYLKRSDAGDARAAFAELAHCQERLTYTCSVQEGVEIGQKLNLKVLSKPILILTYEDPLTPHLRLPFLKGDLTHWSHIDSFSSSRHPNPEMLLAQVDYVFEPKFFASKFHEEAYVAKKALFHTALERDFSPTLDHSSLKTWLIWQRVLK